MSIKHNKLQSDYRHMEETLLKQHKEVEDFKVDNVNAYQVNNEMLTKGIYRWTKIYKCNWPLMKS